MADEITRQVILRAARALAGNPMLDMARNTPVPSPANPLAQTGLGMPVGDAVENASIGFGHEIANGLEGLYGLATDPYAGTQMLEGLYQIATNPGPALAAAGEYVKKNATNPLGLGALAAMAVPISRKPKAVGNLFEAVDDPALARRMALRGEHLKRTKGNGYVGAPAWVKSPQQLGKLRKDADAQVMAGSFNMDWYERARNEALALSDDPVMQKLFARGTAAYSPQAAPPTEVNAFARQHNAKMLTGEDIVPRTKSQARNVGRAYQDDGLSPESIRLGKKTGPYSDAKDATIPEETLYRTANDIWHGRVMGYGEDFSRGFTPQEHGFLTGENLLLAERAAERDALAGVIRGAPWNPRSAQAATWGALRKERRIRELVERHAKAQEKKKPQNRKPLDMDSIEREAEAYAKAGIDDAVSRNAGYLTNEARTGAGVNHLKMADDETKLIDDYTNLVRDQTGRDPVIEGLGMYQKEPTPNRGFYTNTAGELESNPGWTNQVLLGSELKGLPHTSAPEAAAMDYAARVGALNRAQEAGAWSRFFPQGMGKQRVADMNAVMFDSGSLTPQQWEALRREAKAAGADIVDYGNGQTVIAKFGDEGPIAGTTKDLATVLDRAGYQGTGTRGVIEGGYEVTGLTSAPGSGAATKALLDAADSTGSKVKDLGARTDPGIARQARVMNAIDQAIADASGKAVREDLVKLREIMGKGYKGKVGVAAVRAYVEEYGVKGLPAVVLGALGLSSARENATQGQDAPQA